MSTTSTAPEATASPIPQQAVAPNDNAASSRPVPKPDMPQPKLRLEIRDLSHPGALVFLQNVNAIKTVSDAVTIVVQSLYEPFTGDLPTPAVRSITLVLKPMNGVAYTTGTELDDDHKEIHFSLDYISRVSKDDRVVAEIEGVLTHEMVHVWQHNGKGKAPGGLIEGVADFIRLKAGYAPPHWKREPGMKWDAGYEQTAYFLEWLEAVYGTGKVRDVNDKLREEEYQETTFWKDLFGQSIETLWKAYQQEYENREALKKGSQANFEQETQKTTEKRS